MTVSSTPKNMRLGEIERRLYINGEWTSGKTGTTFPVFNPTTEEHITDVHEADIEDVDVAVAAAKHAFPAWRDLSMFDRVEKCIKLAELIDRDRNEIAQLEAVSMGIPVSAYLPCISAAIDGIKHASGLAHDIHGETSLNTPGFVTFTLRQPFGVCAAIIPWNVPIIMWCGKVIPCVVTGNTIVLKSSEKAPLTSLKLAALAAEAGFPPSHKCVVRIWSHHGPRIIQPYGRSQNIFYWLYPCCQDGHGKRRQEQHEASMCRDRRQEPGCYF